MKKNYSISAILLNYNHGAYIDNALDAALNQTVPFDEVIIIDDASTDNSVQLINKRIEGKQNVRLIQNPHNLGITSTINKGVKEATGDFIFIISADDKYNNRIVEFCKPVIEQYPDIAMVAGNARVCNSDTGKERVFTIPFPQEVGRYSREDLEEVARKRAFTFYGGATLISRDAMVKAGGHLENLKWHADWFLYLLVGCRHPFAVVPEEFIQIRQTSDQYSHACYDWKKQRPVIEEFIITLQKDYPKEYIFFRDSGLLPTYDFAALLLLLKDNMLREYLTPLLVWRLMTYKLFRVVGRLLPDDLRSKIRQLVRV